MRRIALILAVLASGPAPASADLVSDNLANASSDAEVAAGDRWLAASFATASEPLGYTLDAVTLRLAAPGGGDGVLDVYDDGGLQPGAWVGSLVRASDLASEFSEVAFEASGIALEPDATYWVVLAATSGELEWAWTQDNSGDGSGFQFSWGDSDDGGASWFSYAIYPTQMRVVATVPEPAASAAVLVALTTCAQLRHRRSSR